MNQRNGSSANHQRAGIRPRAVRIRSLLALLALSVLVGRARPTSAQVFCTGDCNGGSTVNSGEFATCVAIQAGTRPLSDCLACDCNLDGMVSAEEVARAEQNLRQGCPFNDCVRPTPSPTNTVNPLTPSSTPTVPPPTATTGPSGTATEVQSTATATTSGTPAVDATATVPPGTCLGDCNGDGRVLVNELVIGVNITLEGAPLSACRAFDANATNTVSVDELVRGVNNLLRGCSVNNVLGGEGIQDSHQKASRTGPSRTGPSRTGPSRTGPSRTGPSRTGPSRTGQPWFRAANGRQREAAA